MAAADAGERVMMYLHLVAIFLRNESISCEKRRGAAENAYLEANLAEIPQRPEESRHDGRGCGSVDSEAASRLNLVCQVSTKEA